MRRRFFPVALGLFAAFLVVALAVGFGCFYTVDEREHAVVVRFGEPLEAKSEPGLYFKTPVIDEVRRLPKTLQFYRTGPGDKLEDLPTADARKIEVSAFAIWRITDPMQFVKVLRTVENAEERVVRARVKSEIRNVVTAENLAEVVRSSNRELTYNFGQQARDAAEEAGVQEPVAEGEAALGEVTDIRVGREQLIERIKRQVIARLSGDEAEDALDRGVELIDVGISNIEFVPTVRAASFARFRTELESYATAYRTTGERRRQEILNATNAEAERIKGEGERRSKELRGQIDARNIEEFAAAIRETGDFYAFQKTLEVYREALKGDTRLILTTDSELLGMLKTLGPAAEAAPTSPGVAAAE